MIVPLSERELQVSWFQFVSGARQRQLDWLSFVSSIAKQARQSRFQCLQNFEAVLFRRKFTSVNFWKFIECTPVDITSSLFLMYSAPLLKKERNVSLTALFPQLVNPVSVHWPGSMTALPADNYPLQAFKVNFTEVFEEGFDREKLDCCRNTAQVFDARQSVLAILHADSPPDVLAASSVAKFGCQHVSHSFRTLR